MSVYYPKFESECLRIGLKSVRKVTSIVVKPDEKSGWQHHVCGSTNNNSVGIYLSQDGAVASTIIDFNKFLYIFYKSISTLCIVPKGRLPTFKTAFNIRNQKRRSRNQCFATMVSW